ncbi:MAG: hypothetical protein KA436_01450 [Oligoflexales bacterium]|nr:hypothetical protein [Oligoflexales bacterium]
MSFITNMFTIVGAQHRTGRLLLFCLVLLTGACKPPAIKKVMRGERISEMSTAGPSLSLAAVDGDFRAPFVPESLLNLRSSSTMVGTQTNWSFAVANDSLTFKITPSSTYPQIFQMERQLKTQTTTGSSTTTGYEGPRGFLNLTCAAAPGASTGAGSSDASIPIAAPYADSAEFFYQAAVPVLSTCNFVCTINAT